MKWSEHLSSLPSAVVPHIGLTSESRQLSGRLSCSDTFVYSWNAQISVPIILQQVCGGAFGLRGAAGAGLILICMLEAAECFLCADPGAEFPAFASWLGEASELCSLSGQYNVL